MGINTPSLECTSQDDPFGYQGLADDDENILVWRKSSRLKLAKQRPGNIIGFKNTN
jgi:hypothetical protein